MFWIIRILLVPPSNIKRNNSSQNWPWKRCNILFRKKMWLRRQVLQIQVRISYDVLLHLSHFVVDAATRLDYFQWNSALGSSWMTLNYRKWPSMATSSSVLATFFNWQHFLVQLNTQTLRIFFGFQVQGHALRCYKSQKFYNVEFSMCFKVQQWTRP